MVGSGIVRLLVTLLLYVLWGASACDCFVSLSQQSTVSKRDPIEVTKMNQVSFFKEFRISQERNSSSDSWG